MPTKKKPAKQSKSVKPAKAPKPIEPRPAQPVEPKPELILTVQVVQYPDDGLIRIRSHSNPSTDRRVNDLTDRLLRDWLVQAERRFIVPDTRLRSEL